MYISFLYYVTSFSLVLHIEEIPTFKVPPAQTQSCMYARAHTHLHTQPSKESVSSYYSNNNRNNKLVLRLEVPVLQSMLNIFLLLTAWTTRCRSMPTWPAMPTVCRSSLPLSCPWSNSVGLRSIVLRELLLLLMVQLEQVQEISSSSQHWQQHA